MLQEFIHIYLYNHTVSPSISFIFSLFYQCHMHLVLGFPGGSVVKNPPANAEDSRCWFDPCVGKIPWSTKWQPIPEFLPEKFHGQRSLLDYSPWVSKSQTRLSTPPLTHLVLYLRSRPKRKSQQFSLMFSPGIFIIFIFT